MFKKRVKREPDAFHQTFQDPLERLSGRSWAILSGLGILALAAAAMWFFINWSGDKEAAGWQRYADALQESDTSKQALLLEKAAENSPGTDARPVALLDAAAILQEVAAGLPPDQKLKREQSLKHARNLLEQFLAEYPGHEWAVLARERRGLVLESSAELADDKKKAYGEAVQAFQDAYAAAEKEKSGFAFLSGKLLYGQARCELALGNRDEAVKLLRQALEKRVDDKGTEWYQAAEALLARNQTARKSLLVAGAVRDLPPEPEKPAKPEKTESPSKKPSGP